jgi:glycogen operon protein
MTDADWDAGFVKCLGVRLAGDLIGDVDERGEPIVGDTLLLLLNAHHEPIPFTQPATKAEHHWEPLLDTAKSPGEAKPMAGGEKYPLEGRSLTVLGTVLQGETGHVITTVQVEALRKGDRKVPQPTALTVPG